MTLLTAVLENFSQKKIFSHYGIQENKNQNNHALERNKEFERYFHFQVICKCALTYMSLFIVILSRA